MLGVSTKDGVSDSVGRVSFGNERGRKHKIVPVSNENLRFCDRRTLDRSTLDGYAIRFDMGIKIDAMRAINWWQR